MLSTIETMTVTEAVYQAAGNPPVDRPVSFDGPRFCGNCRRTRPGAPAHKILTSQFGSWDHITADPHGARWLCTACAWSYRAADYRRRNTVVTAAGSVNHPESAQLREMLTRPIPADTAIIVPVSTKKIVLPLAQWGMLATDAGCLSWRPRHHKATTAATRLRDLGCSEPELSASAPPFRVVSALSASERLEVAALWRSLASVRADKAAMGLIQNLSRRAKKA